MTALDRCLLTAFDAAVAGAPQDAPAALRRVARVADRRHHSVAAMARLALLAIRYRRDGRGAGAVMAEASINRLRAQALASPEGVWCEVMSGKTYPKGLELV